MSRLEHLGQRFEVHEGYRLDMNAYCIELTNLSREPPEIVASVMCNEGASELVVSVAPDVSTELVRRITEIAEQRLPEWQKNWDASWDRHWDKNRD